MIGGPPLDMLETDALTELVNIGIGKAASGLREMVGEQILLSVPRIEVLSRDVAIASLQAQEPGTLVGIHQIFKGDVSGAAILVFPNEQSFELVRAVTGGELSREDILDLEPEALAEIGNIVLNGCLATIANNIQQTFRMSLPEVVRGDADHIFTAARASQSDEMALFLHVNFTLAERNIRGYVTILMDVGSLLTLKHLLSIFIERTA